VNSKSLGGWRTHTSRRQRSLAFDALKFGFAALGLICAIDFSKNDRKYLLFYLVGALFLWFGDGTLYYEALLVYPIRAVIFGAKYVWRAFRVSSGAAAQPLFASSPEPKGEPTNDVDGFDDPDEQGGESR